MGFYLLIVTTGVGLGAAVSIYLMTAKTELPPLEMVTNLKVSLRNMIPSTMVLLSLSFLFLAQFNFFPKIDKKMRSRISFMLPLAILLIAALELLRFAWKNTPFSPREFLFPKTQIITFLQNQKQPFRIAGGIPLNLFMPFKISSAEGYDPIYPRQNAEWFSAVNWGNLNSPSGRYGLIHDFSSPLIDFANVQYIVDYKKNIYGGISERGDLAPGNKPPRYLPVFTEGRITVFKNTENLPRVWLSTNYKVVDGGDGVIQELDNPKSVKEKLIILESEPQYKISNTPWDYSVEEFGQGFNRIDFRVSVSTEALAFLSESYNPGWQAYVDGRQTQILKANFLFQAIAVPGGTHKISFIYDPKSFRIGKEVALATLVFLIGFTLYEQTRKRFKAS